MTAAAAVIVHRMPGRMRLRLAGKRGDAGFFSSLTEEISAMPAIDGVKVNPMTGSVVIHYSGPDEELIRQLEENRISVESPHQPEEKRAAHPPGNDTHGSHAEPFLLVSNRDINPMFMLGTLLAAAGVIQIFRGRILVPSLSLMWYAMEAFRHARTPASSQAATDRMEGYRAGMHQGPGSDDMVH